MSADLHCHTKLSDGSLGIDDLIILAKKQGINTIAITDRNCQAGNVRGELTGKRHDVKVIPGTAFGECGEGYIRVSYSYSINHIREALKRMQEFVDELKNS